MVGRNKDTLLFFLDVNVCFEIGVHCAVFHSVTKCFAAATPLYFHFLLLVRLFTSFASFDLLVLVLSELAARLVLVCLAAAPPKRTAPVGLMRATGPVIVLFFVVLGFAVVASLGLLFVLVQICFSNEFQL